MRIISIGFIFTPPPLFGAFYIQVACEEVTFRGEKIERGQVIILKREVNLLQKLKCKSFFNWIEISDIKFLNEILTRTLVLSVC